MSSATGILLAFFAAIAFGVQYVPVKKYEIYDGTTFQWFMCSGILMMGFFIALFSGDVSRGLPELVILGGVLWGISNYLVLPLVKLLGIGLGFSLYHFVNLVVGYLTGRFGFFGVPMLQGQLHVCDVGCVLIAISFVAMIFVEDSPHPETPATSAPDPIADAGAGSGPLTAALCEGGPAAASSGHAGTQRGRGGGRQAQWPAAGRVPPGRARSWSWNGPDALERADHIAAFGCFSACSAAQDIVLDPEVGANSPPCPGVEGRAGGTSSCPDQALAGGSRARARTLSSGVELPVDGPGRLGNRCLGVMLAILAGSLCGVQSVPATLYNARNPGSPPTAVVLPQCMGVWVSSTAIYTLYAGVARISGWRVPHSVIRPAFVSGCIWALGFALMIGAISNLGYSVGYTLDAVGPIVVSSLLSVFVFGEIRGRRQLTLYVCALSCQLVGTVLIAAFGKEAG